MARVPPVHDGHLRDSKLSTDFEQRLVDFVIHRRVDHGEKFYPVVDLSDVILRVPRASIFRELHFSLAALFAPWFTQCFQGLATLRRCGTFRKNVFENSALLRGLVARKLMNIPRPVPASDRDDVAKSRTVGRTDAGQKFFLGHYVLQFICYRSIVARQLLTE